MANTSATPSPISRLPLIITIDGPAGVGKSTVAKLLAHRLGWVYLDTGATYRAVAYEALRRGLNPCQAIQMAQLARRLPLTLNRSAAGQVSVRLKGRDVTRAIRTERVTDAAAIVAQHPQVRLALVRLQRRLARASGVVVEGRDTGSFVFPRAPYKFFLTATLSVRAARRQRELRQVQGRSPSRAVIARQLRARDGLDLRRTLGPLIKPCGAVLLDTSHLSAPRVVSRLLRHIPL